MRLEWLCSPLEDSELFQDDLFFGMPDEESEDEEEGENNTTVEDIEEIKRICKHNSHQQIVREVRKRLRASLFSFLPSEGGIRS